MSDAGATASDLPLDREPGQNDKARLAEEILLKQGDMHSHYDIGPWQGGFAVFRIYEIDDQMLERLDLPTGQQVFGHAETLQQLHEAIIDGSALGADPQWITDGQMNEAQNSQSLNLDAPTHEGMHDNRVAPADSAVRDFQFTASPDRLGDLLIDLMHFADRQGFDFEQELEHARASYTAEREARQTSGTNAEAETANERLEPFSEQDLYRDPWSAVYQAIPDGADRTLLELAYLAASQCRASVTGSDSELGPEVGDLYASPAENFDRATARLAELEARLEDTQAAGEAAWPPLPPLVPEQPQQAAVPPERGIGATLSGLFHGAERFVSDIFDWFADMISPSPPPTPAMVMARAEAAQTWERARAAEDEYRELLEEIGDSEEDHPELSSSEEVQSRGQRR
jgi:hypothetical protein